MNGKRSQRIKVEGVTKLFGTVTPAVLDRLDRGEPREAINRATGCVLGLRDVSFDVAEGEILVVMGLSGSGKSTMLRCLNRLIEPTRGRVLVDGVDVTRLTPVELRAFRRKTFGMVFQHFALFPHRTIQDNVEFGLEIQGVEPTRRRDRAMQAIQQVGLKGWEKARPSQLSGGMRQRAGLARALATDADILLMDEAFSALDPLIRREMQKELVQLQSKLKKTIVFVSHDLDEAIALGGRIVLMKDGEIVQIGMAEEILAAPANDYVADFVEHINVLSVLTAGRIAEPVPLVLQENVRVADLPARLPTVTTGTLCVVDEAGRLVGTVTDDLLRAGAVVHPERTTLGDLAARNGPVVRGDASLQAALAVLAGRQAPVPTVDDDGALIGMLTARAVVDALAHRQIPPGGDAGATDQKEAAWTGSFPSSPLPRSATASSRG
jgi:glycine betaine/proline transport system ATP-binding protein